MGLKMTDSEILNARILIVDDADANLRLLEALLAKEDLLKLSAQLTRLKPLIYLLLFNRI